MLGISWWKYFYVVYDTTVSKTTSVLKVYLCSTCNHWISFQVCCLPPPRGFCSMTTSPCQDQSEKTWSRPDCYMPRLLQPPCKPKLLRRFCSLCSSHNIDLWICLLPSSAFSFFMYLTCPGQYWIAKEVVNSKVSSSQAPWWPNKGSQLKNRNKIITRKMKGYIRSKLDSEVCWGFTEWIVNIRWPCPWPIKRWFYD